MIIVISYPMLNGAPVATCRLSHTVVVQTQRVKSENGGSLDESEAKDLSMVQDFPERGTSILQPWTKVNVAIIFHSQYKLMLMGCTCNRKYMLP